LDYPQYTAKGGVRILLLAALCLINFFPCWDGDRFLCNYSDPLSIDTYKAAAIQSGAKANIMRRQRTGIVQIQVEQTGTSRILPSAPAHFFQSIPKQTGTETVSFSSVTMDCPWTVIAVTG